MDFTKVGIKVGIAASDTSQEDVDMKVELGFYGGVQQDNKKELS